MISAVLLVSAAFAQTRPTVAVNCDNGQSLNTALSKLNKHTPTTVTVQGTCTDFVTVDDFEDLTLIGQSGAVIQQPATKPQNNSYVLSMRYLSRRLAQRHTNDCRESQILAG